jgi:hypothetical protein
MSDHEQTETQEKQKVKPFTQEELDQLRVELRANFKGKLGAPEQYNIEWYLMQPQDKLIERLRELVIEYGPVSAFNVLDFP